MDRAHSFSGGQKPSPSPSAVALPAYQQRLLDGTSSRPGGSLSRSSSQTANVILNNPTGTRHWTPRHRVTQSLSAVKGRFEERARADTTPEPHVLSPEPKLDNTGSTDSHSSASDASFHARYADLLSRTPTRRRAAVDLSAAAPTTPAYQKRYTLPDPIIAAPLSPNTTGVTIESPDEASSTSELHRIRLPVSSPLDTSARRHNHYSVPLRDDDTPDSPSSTILHRARALEALDPTSTGSSTASDATTSSSLTSASSRTFSDASSTSNLHRRPTSIYGGQYSTPSSPDKYPFGLRPRSHTASARSSPADSADKHEASSVSSASTPRAPSSAMSPQPFRSSYMNNRSSKLPEKLLAGRKMGRHLPRIASGEVHDEYEGEEPADEEPPPPPPAEDWRTRRAERERRARSEGRGERRSLPAIPSPSPRDSSFVGVGEGDDVAGMRGRLRLSRDMTPAPVVASPLPSSRYTRGLWADVQRHLLQAYEYLCHIGEAKEWMEGCLGEQLPYDVTDMEERMRDGVVLAKLVRVFQGEAVVRRIYEVCSS